MELLVLSALGSSNSLPYELLRVGVIELCNDPCLCHPFFPFHFEETIFAHVFSDKVAYMVILSKSLEPLTAA